MEERPNGKKRVLIFSTAYLPMLGGAEVAVKEITDRLSGEFEFDLICARIKKELPAQEKIGNVNVWRVGRGWRRLDKFLLPWRGFRLAQLLHGRKKYDAVWAIMASFGGLAALFFKEQFSGVPYVLTVQEGDSSRYIMARARWLGSYYKKIFREADQVTAISNYLKEFALKQGARLVEVIPNGVDPVKFLSLRRPSGKESAGQGEKTQAVVDIKNKLGVKENERVVITVSRLVPKNGIIHLIEAIKELERLNPAIRAKLLIIGSGFLEKSLRARVGNLGLGGKVLFFGDIPNDLIPRYLAIADVFARPSLSEGLGISFLEAMAAGVPVIATPVGGIPDFLKDPSTGSGQATGLFCEVNNPRSIAQKLELILTDSALRERLIINGRDFMRENYNWDAIAPKMKKIFNCLISKIC